MQGYNYITYYGGITIVPSGFLFLDLNVAVMLKYGLYVKFVYGSIVYSLFSFIFIQKKYIKYYYTNCKHKLFWG